MREKPSKKVVIINDIASDSIEQAIFILRNAGMPQSAGGTATIVQEAQRVINAYVETMEKTQKNLLKKEKKQRYGKGRHRWPEILLALLPLAGFSLAMVLAFRFFG